MQIKYYTIKPEAVEHIRAEILADQELACTLIEQGREGAVISTLVLHAARSDQVVRVESQFAGMITDCEWPE